ncbi:scavenger receptor cysteine-rich type 1 protein M130-like isoform X2 [Acanthochromis polyacanthus]|uniref:scavenger receptor cysteine-rich type 1 protein M130-like isoform X2 n=1 Tax=Acanthochromis polyacanthus TaxID=80966 RepID=UPI002234443E|nr:scavenger receptor cysteine-rich type 1 protein M130-like isoform X2 [Acanthochromis polyacanthus]
MDLRALTLFVGLCSSGPSPCSGRLEQQRQSDWEPVRDQNLDWNLTAADQVCRRISCGSVVSLRRTLDQEPPQDLVTREESRAEGTPERPPFRVEITCSDSVRLENGTDRCSGRLQVKRNQVWSSVCSDGFDLQDAEVVCRELGCGSPSGFKEELYGEAPEWIPEFRCGGHESALLHCERSDRDTCSPGTTVTLTCSDPGWYRLVEGSGRCDGTLEGREWDEWRPVDYPYWNLRLARMVCRDLDCGSPLSTRRRETGSKRTWGFEPLSTASSHYKHQTSSGVIEITCSDFVRLEDRTHRCSGRLQVKRNQVWSSVCSDGFDLQDAEVVCRELGCGSPSGFKEELYGEATEWIPEFRCGGHESALLHCERSDRDTCSPGTTVTLTCSDPDDVRLEGGASRCAGRLEMKHDGVWRAMKIPNPDWNLNLAALICGQLDCGPALSAVNRPEYPQEDAWWIYPYCLHSALKDCLTVNHEQISDSLEVTCSDSVRLVGGTHRCSGRLQVKRNQVWSSVCSDGFDLQDAEVVCRELGCGSPSGFKEELYGEAPEWIPEFRCGGHESALLHCERSDRDTCSPGTTVTLTCSAPDQVRLVGNRSTCAGELQMKVHEDWRPVVDIDWYWNQNWTSAASSVCSQLGCGSIVTTDLEEIGSKRPMWIIQSSCFQSTLSLQDCLVLSDEARDSDSLQVICSDLLVQPNISVSSSRLEVQQQKVRVLLGSNFSIICSTRPQYPGGSFQLVFNSSSSTLNYVLPAVTHSAVFLFPAAEGLHRGTYTCIYHLYVFSHNFSSTSRPIYLIPSAPLMDLIIRLVVHLLVMVLLISVTCFYSRKYSVETRSRNEETNVVAELQ